MGAAMGIWKGGELAVGVEKPGGGTAPDASATACAGSAEAGTPGKAELLDDVRLTMLQSVMPPESLREFLGLFLEQTDERAARIEAASAAGDLAALGREAHSLLGAAGNVGAVGVSRLAQALETACRAGEREAAERLGGGLLTAANLTTAAPYARPPPQDPPDQP